MSALLRQVALQRSSPGGVYLDVAWVDDELGRVGKRLRVEATGEIWTVVEVYGTRRREFVEATRPAQKHMREVVGG